MTDDWPPYFNHSKANFHALGVIAAVFNLLEHRLLGLLLLYMGVDNVTAFLFQRLRDNTARVDLLSRAVELRAESAEIKEAVLHFAAGFGACAANRNILLHSLPVIGRNDPVPSLSFAKAARGKDLEWNRYFADLKTLRRVGDETHGFAQYGMQIFNYVVAKYRQKELEGPFPRLPILLTPQEGDFRTPEV